uniref:Adhesion G-protein coupled receptor D1-like n=1 Tax=Phallusia mammillata TaxID=59560 RepID=A0A6F9D6F9_9ASCI|nr:adhesion G-protein coupled receptor D1-like [Phallusia mammillata]
MTEIDPTKTGGGNVLVKMQFLNETTHSNPQSITITIKHYEACVPMGEPYYEAHAYLNSAPTNCLNLSHYCNTSSTTQKETTTQFTSGSTKKPITNGPEAKGFDETQKIQITNLTIPQKGKLPDISFSGVTVDPSLVADFLKAKIIAAQLQANANITRYTKNTINGDYKNFFEPKPGTPALNLTVVSENNTHRLQAKLSFVINHKNIDVTAYILSTISSNISRYRITRLKQVNAACGFFDTTKQQFSTDGCSTTSTTTTSITCFCNHTTVFAILLSVQSYDIPSAVVLLSYITESISILCLIITIVILMAVRKQLRSSRTAMQINLSVAILCLHTFSMFHELALKENRACEVFTIATHFFLLATGKANTLIAIIT